MKKEEEEEKGRRIRWRRREMSMWRRKAEQGEGTREKARGRQEDTGVCYGFCIMYQYGAWPV